MGVPEKLGKQASDVLGVRVAAAAMVVPPGATLYRAFSPKSGMMTWGGPIAAAIASKLDSSRTGMASAVPSKQGVLALTSSHLVFLQKKRLGIGVSQELTRWERSAVTLQSVAPEEWRYPGLALTFSDGSRCMVYGEGRWGLDALARAS